MTVPDATAGLAAEAGSRAVRGAGTWLIVGDAASIHVRRIATAFAGMGLEVHVATFEGAPFPGVTLHHLGNRSAESDIRYLLALPRLARLIRRLRPAIVHAHYVSSYGLMAALALRLALPRGPRPKLVQTAWGSDLLVTARASRLRGAMAAIALRPADLVTGDSADLLEEAGRLAPKVPRHRFVFGPPDELLGRDEPRERVFISARNLVAGMRIPLIVEAFVAARESGELTGWRLVVAGSGPERSQVERQARDGVTILGAVDQPTLHDLMARARVAVSVPESDATSAALLEALATGLRVVVNDLPANREWVDPAIGIITSRDPSRDELARAMIDATRLGPADPRQAVSSVTWSREIDRLREAIEAQTWRS